MDKLETFGNSCLQKIFPDFGAHKPLGFVASDMQQSRIFSYYSAVSGDPAAVHNNAQRARSDACMAADATEGATGAAAGTAGGRRLAIQARSSTSRASDAMLVETDARTADEEAGEAIDETDNEQESEGEMLSEDEQFICDGDDEDATGCEQRERDAVGYESENAEQEYEHAIAAVSRRRRVTAKKHGSRHDVFEQPLRRSKHGRRVDDDNVQDSGDDEPAHKKQKTRTKQRDLVVTCERGRGDVRRTVNEYRSKAPFFLPCADVVTPWDMQPGRQLLGFGVHVGRLAVGAFGSAEHACWMRSDERQTEFARRFGVPVNETYLLKKISTDVPNTLLDPVRCHTNSTAKVLHSIRVLHKQSELDVMESKNYEQVFVGLQHSSRELQLAMHGGPNGGLQGCAVDVLWRINDGEDASNVSESTLRLLDMLTMAKQGSKGDEVLHVTTTDRVDWFTKGKVGLSKVQCGVHTKRAYDFDDAQKKRGYCAVQDVDHRLLRKVWGYRQEADFDNVRDAGGWPAFSELVHTRCQVNNAQQMLEDVDEQETEFADTSTLRLFLYKDVLPAWDSTQKQLTTVSIEGIYIIATSPDNDPLLFLRSVYENNAAAATLLADWFGQMRNVLGLKTCTNDFFATDCKAAEVTPESRMIEGFFRFCSSKGLYNVQLGGMRMDVQDKAEMDEWRHYISCVTQARKQHYSRMLKPTLHDRSHWREAHLPVEEQTSPDFFHGHMYWKVNLRSFEDEISQYLPRFFPTTEHERRRDELFQWRRTHIHSADETCMFIPVGEGWLRNSGIWIKISMDNSRSLDEDRADHLRKHADEFPRWPQPQQVCRLVKIWLSNAKDRAAGNDPLDVMLHRAKWIPDIEWMKTEMPKIDEQHESIQWLIENVGDYTHGSGSRTCSTSMRLHEILLMVGKERNPVHKAIATVSESARLALLFRTVNHKVNTAIKNALLSMQTTELKQWNYAALSINDLKKQNNLKDRWIECYRHVRAISLSMHVEDPFSLLCSSALTFSFLSDSFVRLDADVSYMNQILVWLLTLCTQAHVENRRGAYGMVLRIMDMAGSVDVLKKDERTGRTEVFKVTEKSPGAGADTTLQFFGGLFGAYVNHLCITPELKRHSQDMNDCVHKQVSRMSFSTLHGSGVQVNGKREIVGSSFQKELSNIGHFTELFKNDEDQIAWMESIMAHSGDVQVGAEGGITQGSWSTTQNMEKLDIERLKPLPVIVLTGNRPAKSTPASAVEGARWMNIASSTQDKENGFTVIKGMPGAHNAVRHSLPCARAVDNMSNQQRRDLASRSAQARLANEMSSLNVRNNIKVIQREDAMSNMPFFLLLQWLRRDAALMLSVLTHDAREYCYCIKSVPDRIESAVGQLLKCMRRHFFTDGDDFWHRNARGPWTSVLQNSMHVMLTMGNALLAGLARADDGWPLDLHQCYLLGIRCLMTNTISFMAMLASLHLWLASAVLDYNFMIICCFVYHFTAFQHTCPLRILSLVCRGHYALLTPEEQTMYLNICSYLAPVVLEDVSDDDSFIRRVNCKDLEPKSVEALSEFLSGSPCAIAASSSSTGTQRSSVYIQPRLDFCTKGQIKGFARARDGQHQQPDDNFFKDDQRVIATIMGLAQRPAENTRRFKDGAWIGERFCTTLQPWEDTEDFWKKVRKGTLLPEQSTATNDMHKIQFEFVPHTGLWWDTAIKSAGACSGLVQSFILQSGMDVDITHEQFFYKLFNPFLNNLPPQNANLQGFRVRHAPAWKLKVRDIGSVFRLTFKAHRAQAHGVVSANIAMSLVHYVILQGIGMTADWSKTAHENANFVSCVHLRNVSHMSLGILSLLLHTAFEKAMIPANGGRLLLPLPSPTWQSQSQAVVEYDNRLHVDTLLVDADATDGQEVEHSDNMLSLDSRLATKSNWKVIDFAGDSSALFYKTVIQNSRPTFTTASQIFPFPPEAVAHVRDFQKYMASAHKRFAERLDKEEDLGVVVSATENVFALAMFNLAGSIRFEEFQHMQPSLTDCVVRDEREIPCVTCEHGWLFVLSFSQGVMRVRPVESTHKWTNAALFFQNIATANASANNNAHTAELVPFQKLPAPSADLQSDLFPKFYHHGLKLLQAEECSVAIDISYSDEKRLPFYMFPVMHWPVLLCLGVEWTCKGLYQVCCSENVHEDMCTNLYARSVDTERHWFEEHCAKALREIDAAQKTLELDDIHVFFSSNVSDDPDLSKRLDIWARVRGVRVHFNSVPQLLRQAQTGIDPATFLQATSAGYYMISRFVNVQEQHMHDDGEALEQEWAVLQKTSTSYAKAVFYPMYSDREYVEKLEHEYAETGDPLIAEQIADYDKDAVHTTDDIIVFAETDFEVSVQPPSEESKACQLCWALTVESACDPESKVLPVFLHKGHYKASYAIAGPGAIHIQDYVHLDFITMSRCMIPEGKELWIAVSASTYSLVLAQIEQQQCNVMLPISQGLHAAMPAATWSYLRCYYCLGGSDNSLCVADNCVSVICTIATRDSFPGKPNAEDDNAGSDSRVNMHVSDNQTRLVSIALPVFNDGAQTLHLARPQGMPFYKFLKER